MTRPYLTKGEKMWIKHPAFMGWYCGGALWESLVGKKIVKKERPFVFRTNPFTEKGKQIARSLGWFGS